MNADVRTMLVIALALYIAPIIILWFIGIGGGEAFSAVPNGEYVRIGLVGIAFVSLAYISIYLSAISQVDDDLREMKLAVMSAFPKWFAAVFDYIGFFLLLVITLVGMWFMFHAARYSPVFGSSLGLAFALVLLAFVLKYVYRRNR